MSDQNKEREEAIQEGIKELVKQFDNNGIGVKLTTDGAVFMFKREYLQAMLDKMPDQKSFIIQVKRPDVS